MDCFVAEPVNERAFARPLGRNDGEGYTVIACDKREVNRASSSLRGAQRRSNPVFRFVAQYWIASLRSQ
jgi:hypothetical protein